MLPTKSLFAFFLLHGGGILDLRSGLSLSSCPSGRSARGQKRYGAAPQRVVPALFCMDYSPRRDTRGVLPRIAHVAPATAWPRDLRLHRPRTVYLPLGKDAPTPPQPLGCNGNGQIPTAKVHRWSTWSAMSPVHKRDTKGFSFALTTLSLASNYRTGGLCWLITD